MSLPVHRALRVVGSDRRLGSTWPLVVESDAGRFLAKLRGGAHGTASLIAEIVVGALADRIGLEVPARVLLTIDASLENPDRDQELGDLVRASQGINLGLAFLEGARLLVADEVGRVNPDEAAQVLWLDWLVMNPDRTARNPNLMWWRDRLWLIDHGAALTFQHRWGAVTEDSPRDLREDAPVHLFAARARDLAGWDAMLTPRVDRDALEAALAEVPDDFLAPLVAPAGGAEAIRRRRHAYAAFLWKRLQAPRPSAWGASG